MALATLFNIPKTRQDWLEFSFSNQDSHNKIAIAIFQKYGISIQGYPLDPIPWFELQTWARNHQQWHNDQNAILGIGGADLTIGNLDRQDEIANFIRLHGNEHLLAETQLGVT